MSWCRRDAPRTICVQVCLVVPCTSKSSNRHNSETNLPAQGNNRKKTGQRQITSVLYPLCCKSVIFMVWGWVRAGLGIPHWILFACKAMLGGHNCLDMICLEVICIYVYIWFWIRTISRKSESCVQALTFPAVGWPDCNGSPKMLVCVALANQCNGLLESGWWG